MNLILFFELKWIKIFFLSHVDVAADMARTKMGRHVITYETAMCHTMCMCVHVRLRVCARVRMCVHVCVSLRRKHPIKDFIYLLIRVWLIYARIHLNFCLVRLCFCLNMRKRCAITWNVSFTLKIKTVDRHLCRGVRGTIGFVSESF